MEIAVKEFAGYDESANNHIHDLVVSIRILQTDTNITTPTEIVAAGITHLLEKALSSPWKGGLSLLGYMTAAAFDVKVDSVGGLIEATRDEARDELLEAVAVERSENYKYQAKFATVQAQARDAEAQLLTLTRQYNEALGLNEKLHAEVVETKDAAAKMLGELDMAASAHRSANRSIAGLRREREDMKTIIAVLKRDLARERCR